MRVNVWLPDELAATVKQLMPDANISGILQDQLRKLLGCKHWYAQCSACAKPVDLLELERQAKAQFYNQLLWEIEDLIAAGGTLEGAARVAKAIARAHDLPNANLPLPRPSQLQRKRAAERAWLDQQAAV